MSPLKDFVTEDSIYIIIQMFTRLGPPEATTADASHHRIRSITLNAQRLTMTLAGLFILVSLALAHFNGQIDITKLSWLWFTAFVGANLTQAGITGFCPLTSMLKAAGAR